MRRVTPRTWSLRPASPTSSSGSARGGHRSAPPPPLLLLPPSPNAPQTTGFFLADIQCGDLGLLFGPRTDSASLRLMLENVEKGKPGHKLVLPSPLFLLLPWLTNGE
jgi:hypothetical protein